MRSDQPAERRRRPVADDFVAERATRPLRLPGMPWRSRRWRRLAPHLPVEFRIMPEDAVLVEGDPPRAGEVGLDPRPRRDRVMDADHPLIRAARPAPSPSGRRSAGRRPPGTATGRHRRARAPTRCFVALRVAGEDRLEPFEEARHRACAEGLRPPLRFRLLVLVVEVAAERMMDVMRLDAPGRRWSAGSAASTAAPHRSSAPARAARRDRARMLAVWPMIRLPSLEEGRREGWRLDARAVPHPHQRPAPSSRATST